MTNADFNFDVSIFNKIRASLDESFSVLAFAVLETIRQDSDKAFTLMEDIYKGFFPALFAQAERNGFVKIMKIPEVGESWLNCVDLRQPYLELFKTKGDVVSWIDEWRNKFPAGVRSGGYPVRGDKAGCLVKMKAFVNKYKYPKEVIFKATDKYLALRKKENWAYTQLAHYFIMKDGQSTLAMFCEEVLTTTTGEIEHDFTKSV